MDDSHLRLATLRLRMQQLAYGGPIPTSRPGALSITVVYDGNNQLELVYKFNPGLVDCWVGPSKATARCRLLVEDWRAVLSGSLSFVDLLREATPAIEGDIEWLEEIGPFFDSEAWHAATEQVEIAITAAGQDAIRAAVSAGILTLDDLGPIRFSLQSPTSGQRFRTVVEMICDRLQEAAMSAGLEELSRSADRISR